MQNPRTLNELKKIPHHTVKEVLTSLREWETIHKPYDKGGVFNQFQFIMQTPMTDSPVAPEAALVPFSTTMETVASPNPFILMPHALDQFLARINMRRQDYERMPDKLKVMVANWYIQHPWKTDKDERQVCLRIQDGNKARGLVSARYENVDSADVVEMLMPFTEDSIVREEFRDDKTFHLSVSFPKTATQIRVGDIVEQGIHISNSEVGLRSITVASYVLLLRCLNGNIGGGDDGSFIRFRHVGDRNRIFEAVKTEIESVKMNAEGLVAKMKMALKTAIDDPADMLEKLSKDNQLSQDAYKASLDALLGDTDAHTLYGVANAFTSAAHNFDGEESYELQRMGAKVLALGGGTQKSQSDPLGR
jgi:hypothetical protein